MSTPKGNERPDAAEGLPVTTLSSSRLDWQRDAPKWQQVHHDLLCRIEQGEFRGAFPGELALQQEYGVSRHTVREALRRLREAGLIDSARGRVSQVRSGPIEQSLGGLYSLFEEVEAQGHVQCSLVLSLDVRSDHRAAEALEVPAELDLVYLERVRLSDGEPLAHDRVWLPPELSVGLLGLDFSHAALYDTLERVCGWRPDGGAERISAIVPSGQQRRMLELPVGTACFQVERVGTLRGRPVEFRLSTVRADRYALVAEWTHAGRIPGAGPEALRRGP